MSKGKKTNSKAEDTVGVTKVVLDNEFVGPKATVRHCLGSIESFQQVAIRIPAKKVESTKRVLISLINRLANGDRLSRDDYPPEGDLPGRPGKQSKKFYAFKKVPIRGYTWSSDRVKATHFISHYVNKDYRKLRECDTQRVGHNWSRIEENGDEY